MANSPAAPLKLGGSLNLTPGYRTQVSTAQQREAGAKRQFDAYALWTINPATALRLTASNLAPVYSLETTTIIVGSLRETASTVGSKGRSSRS